MIIMLTYRCSLDCDYCMIDAVSPTGEHMSKETLDAALALFEHMGANVLGIAGGEPLEHPDFWEIIEGIRKKATKQGFAAKVATNGQMFVNRGMRGRISALAPVRFQLTMTEGFYSTVQRPAWIYELRNVYRNDIHHYYLSKKARERGFVLPNNVWRKKIPFCSVSHLLCRELSSSRQESRTLRAFVRHWEGLDCTGCTLHVHPDGQVRLGPLDVCRSIGSVHELSGNQHEHNTPALRALYRGPCGRCGLEYDGDKFKTRRRSAEVKRPKKAKR